MTELEDGAVLRADVGVVGAGLAGIDLARYLARHGVRVVLLESGRLEFDAATQELARVECVGKPLRTHETHGHISGYLPPMYRGYCRLRQFGGTTNLWTGKWRIFDPWDFEPRAWIPHSGWPISLDDLLPFHRETALEYGFGDFDAEARGRAFQAARRRLAPSGLEPHLFFWEKTPTRSGRRFFGELKHSAAIEVVLGANATEVLLHDDLRTVHGVRFRSLDRRSFTLQADQLVLATGGLEVPRLLLASNRQRPAGIGNEHGLVGRFYMDHPKEMDGVLKPGRAIRHLGPVFETRPRPRFAISVSLSYAVQQARSLPQHVVFLKPVRYRGRGPLRHYEVKFSIDQAPHPESRVYLGGETDALGMPRLVVDWRFTARDHEAVAVLERELPDRFAAAGLGRLDFGSRPLSLETMLDASHHMGTTRMASSPAAGVVDAECRVFGTENLYVASSSVFATGHGYSPTYTILALTRRLGAHLLRVRAGATPGCAPSPAPLPRSAVAAP